MLALQKIVKKLSEKPKKLFLIDGTGAILTAFLTGIVLVYFKEFFGMPSKVLYPLALIALGFSIYSFSCFIWLRNNFTLYIRIISVANFLYCCTTITAVVFFFNYLTFWGIYYFISEYIIIFTLVFIEFQSASALNSKA